MHIISYLNTPSLKQEEKHEQGSILGVPVCASNFSTPVVDQAGYTREIHYRIGDRVYIENAD
jgi:hypothetical protein